MKLPLLISVPHAGTRVPDFVEPFCVLTPDQIRLDGDEGAAEIYDLADQVEGFVTTDVPRAIIDMNRVATDRGKDGVVKTHTIWDEVVYDPQPPDSVVEQLLEKYYHPYHDALESAYSAKIRLAVDCHTMAAFGPPVASDSGVRRPAVCLGDNHGTTLPDGWMKQLAASFADDFDGNVQVNIPFSGGFITRHHGRKRPCVQLELTRDPELTTSKKRQRILTSLRRFCEQLGIL